MRRSFGRGLNGRHNGPDRPGDGRAVTYLSNFIPPTADALP